MGINNVVRSRGFKNFMAKLYGWGASVVILGALFKINHYPGAEYMLIVGLGVESIIFFFSAFEPPHVEPDWSLVYPELAGLYHGSVVLAEEEEEELFTKSKPTDELNKMLSDAEINPQLIDNLGKGLRKLSDNASKLSDISDATVATNDYAKNVKAATESVGNLTQAYKKTSENLDQDMKISQEYTNSIKTASEGIGKFSQVYAQASDAMKKDAGMAEEFAQTLKAAKESAQKLTENYTKSSEILSKSAEALDFTALKEANYANQLQKMAQNLSALNASYELQLQSTKSSSDVNSKLVDALEKYYQNINSSLEKMNKYGENVSALNNAVDNQLKGTKDQVDATLKLKTTLEAYLAKLNESADKTLQYNSELDQLAKKVAALNNVYGNMLTAMNVKQ